MTTDALNDCFRAPDTLLAVDDALARLAADLRPITAVETVALTAARGRVLAESPTALINSPPFDNAAMDGFAFRWADLGAGETPLPVVGRVAAGHPLDSAVPPRAAVRIFTGAPLPEGLDTVAMQEDCVVDESGAEPRVTLPTGLAAGNFVRRQGEDFVAGAAVLTPGRRLRPQDLAIAAGAGARELRVHGRLRVGVFSTGDEVVDPGMVLAPGQIFCSNRFGLLAAAEALGAQVSDLGHLPDSRPTIGAALAEAARSHDVLITSGGVSVGGEDHVLDAVRDHGTVSMWRLAIKPGKPTAFGTVGPATAFIGLPGYPVSSMVTFMILGRAVLLRLMGATAEPLLPPAYHVRADFDFAKKHKRRQFLRATVDHAGPEPVCRIYPSQEPHVLSSVVHSDGLVDVGADVAEIRRGEPVPFLPYGTILPC